MTVSGYLECAGGCTIRDEHYDTCTDPDCRGCVPRGAEVGCLCLRCWRALEVAWSEWALLEPYLLRFDRLSPRNYVGGHSHAGPRVPLSPTYLAWEEVRSWLVSEPQDPMTWISTIEGAVQAMGFEDAVRRAVKAHQYEEKSRQLQRMRCPNCGAMVVRQPPADRLLPVEVACASCGWKINEYDQWTQVRKEDGGWVREHPDALEVIADIEAIHT